MNSEFLDVAFSIWYRDTNARVSIWSDHSCRQCCSICNNLNRYLLHFIIIGTLNRQPVAAIMGEVKTDTEAKLI